jgi:dienelactone hydrolase
MVMSKTKLVPLIVGVLCLSAYLASPCPAYAQAYLPVGSEAFYVPPADLSGYERGDIIRWETEPGMDASLTQYGTPYRIMYVSKGASGQKIAVTGMVFIPVKDKGPLDAVVWAHGTVGLGDNCAPSKWPLLYPVYNWPNYSLPTKRILKEGYAAIAVDYEGLGTPGLHPWMHAESAGNTIVDSVRAYSNLAAEVGYQTTHRWGVWGHSQGALAARAANVLANQAAPDLAFVGSVEVSGFNNANVSADFVENAVTRALGAFPYLGYSAHAIRSLYPGFEVTNLLGPLFLEEVEVQPGVAVPLFELAGELCYEDWFFGLIDMVGLDLPADVIRNPDYLSDPVAQEWIADIAFGGFGLDDHTLVPASGPAYIITGESDDLYPPSMQAAYLEDLSLTGALEYDTLVAPKSNHDEALEKRESQAINWLRAQFGAN